MGLGTLILGKIQVNMGIFCEAQNAPKFLIFLQRSLFLSCSLYRLLRGLVRLVTAIILITSQTNPGHWSSTSEINLDKQISHNHRLSLFIKRGHNDPQSLCSEQSLMELWWTSKWWWWLVMLRLFGEKTSCSYRCRIELCLIVGILYLAQYVMNILLSGALEQCQDAPWNFPSSFYFHFLSLGSKAPSLVSTSTIFFRNVILHININLLTFLSLSFNTVKC